MLHKLSAAAIKYRKVTLFIVVLTVLFGVFSYYVSPKQEAPEIKVPVAVLTTIYPGASPADTELFVTRKIEEEIAEVRGFDYSTSHTSDGLSVVVMRLQQDADIDKAWESLRQRIRDLQRQLPEGVQDIEINVDLADTAGFILALTGADNQTLFNQAEQIKRDLLRVSGVARIDILGETQQEIEVVLDIDGLFYMPLTIESISQRLQLQNTDIPSGSIQEHDANMQIRTPSSYQNLNDVADTIIMVSSDDGSVLRLRDIATVQIAEANDSIRIYHNSMDAVLIAGYFQESVNIVHVGKNVEQQIDEIKKTWAKENRSEVYGIEWVTNQPRDVDRAVKQFVNNLLIGIALVLVVVLFGMGMRNALVVSTAIPVSILATLGLMNFMNVDIHQVSIVALIIGLGMLVDNAIVVSDAIQVRLDQGAERLVACLEGVQEVARPVATSTITTVAAFMPLLLLPNVAGEYVRSLPLIVMLALIMSYIVALTVTPTLAWMFFKVSNLQNINKQQLAANERVKQQPDGFVVKWFSRGLELALRFKLGTFAVIVCLIAVGAGAGSQLGLQFFPKADKDIIHIEVKSELSNDLEYTDQLVAEVEAVLRQFPEVRSYTSVVGGGLPKFYDTADIIIPGRNVAQILLRLDLTLGDLQKNTQFVQKLQSEFDQHISAGTVTVLELEQGEPIGSPVRLRLYGDDMQRLYQVSDAIQLELKKIAGATNVHSNAPKNIYQFYVDVDNTRAGVVGISKYDVQRDISAMLRGREATELRIAGKEYPLIVKGNINSLEQLKRAGIVSSATNNKLQLQDIAQVRLEQQTPTINKYNGEVSLTVYSDVLFGYSPVRIQEQLELQLQGIDTQGVSLQFDGEREKIKEYFGEVGVLAVFAVLLIFALLLIQFNSYRQVLVVLFALPLSATGSLAGLWLFNQPLSFTALLGIVSMFGIVVNNAIVLVDTMNQGVFEAAESPDKIALRRICVAAVRRRLRPVILTTITTIMGLMPLVVSGSEMFRPLSISIMSGLVTATVLTLVVIPVLYELVENKKSTN